MRTLHDGRLADGGLTHARASKTSTTLTTVTTEVNLRLLLFASVWAVLLVGSTFSELPTFSAASAQSGPGSFTIPPVAPVVQNWDFECDLGYSPTFNDRNETVFLADGWTLARASGGPVVHSTRIFFENRARAGAGCESDTQFIEKLHGRDSLVIRSRDMETPPEPGKPFDVVFYQRFPATAGGVYSASGWFVSLCGGSASPNDCPAGNYISKQLGIDPRGGTNPDSPNITWTESRAPHVMPNGERVGWANLRVAAVAQSSRVTLFARVLSPFRWHGNFVYVDAINLVRAPLAQFLTFPSTVTGSLQLPLTWEGAQSPDVLLIPGGTYQLLFDLQYRRRPNGDWRDIETGIVGRTTANATVPCTGNYEFRIRARAEQPPAPPDGASPNQRYPGVWSTPVRVRFVPTPSTNLPFAPSDHSLYLPAIHGQPGC